MSIHLMRIIDILRIAKKEIKADCLGVNSVSMCGIIGMGPIQLSMIINDDEPVEVLTPQSSNMLTTQLLDEKGTSIDIVNFCKY
ncbi:MAG: hypothetical protein WBX01_00165 [Nitrososphaeraceae archaeon]